MKKTLLLYIFIICQTCCLSAQANDNIAKVNLGLLAALNPKMALFNFQVMGFLRIELGKNSIQKQEAIVSLKSNSKKIIEADKEIEKISHKKTEVNEKIRNLMEQEKTVYVPDMSENGQKQYNELKEELDNLEMQNDVQEYISRYPEYTTPEETRKILASIDKETVEAVKTVAKKQNIDIVLNSSIPASLGYPVTYRKEVLYSTGPVGLDQTLYYTLLSERPEDHTQEQEAKAMAKNYFSLISRPSAQDMLPIKPYPLVLQGGKDILLDSLKVIYENNGIASDTYELISQVLIKEGLAEK